MTSSAIQVEGLGKQYSIGSAPPNRDLRETLSAAFSGTLRGLRAMLREPSDEPSQPSPYLFWALKDVSFEVKTGQAVGLIGNNGSGKSTLLKILSRIVEPTEGYADIRGRVGSLLEVGTGFHYELTGRENIFLNGAILGMTRRETEAKLDEIVAFAGIGKFLDTPVKHYSTGMYTRLAFAVAAHLEPEILLVDEVLAVGDAAFQKKCLAKMEDVTHEGRTIILVSHNMTAIQTLCDHVIWLRDGRIEAQGPAADVVAHYQGSFSSATSHQVWDDPWLAPGNDKVRVHRAMVEGEPDSGSPVLTIQRPIHLSFEYWNLVPGTQLSVGIRLYNSLDTLVFDSTPVHEQRWHGRDLPRGLFRSTCRIPANLLNTGSYRLQVYFTERQAHTTYALDDALVFDLHEEARSGAWLGDWDGVIRPKLPWTTELIQPDAETESELAAVAGP
jgi:lipopolysaccharide transport system ATP-binding protein